MRILVTFAVEAEFAPWRKLREFRKVDSENCFCTRIGDAEIAAMLTGIGCRKSWVEATKAIWDGDVDICVSSGLAGALRPEYMVGEIVAPAKILASKWDKVVACDMELLNMAAIAGAKKVGSFYTSDHVIVQADEKRPLGAFADAVEMESGEVLLEAAAFGARVIAVRAISDTSEEDLPIDFNRVSTDQGNVSIRRIVGRAILSPRSVPSLMRFGQRSKRAADQLAAFLEKYLPSLVALPALTKGGSK